MAQLTVEDFADKEGDKFRLTTDAEETIEVALVEVAAVDVPGAERLQQFSLLFEAPHGTVTRQMIYHLEHDELGGLDLFLVPVFADDEIVRCEAVFT